MWGDFYMVAIPLFAGYVLDTLLGDPRCLPHPVVAFGRLIAFAEKRWNKGGNRRRKGCAVAFLYPLGVGLVCWGMAHACLALNVWCYYAVASVFVFYGLANCSLIEESREVIRTLEKQGIEAGRKRLSWIVGRDTSSLTSKEIYTAVLETMAENLSDGVVAPLFYYALGGFPAMMAYKMVNTLDSMIGYKDERYRQFGCCAARLDDVLNFIPARLTALFMALISYRPGLLKFILHYGPKHASPNAGYPEAALAGILHCRFGGTHVYHGLPVKKPYIGDNNRNLNRRDLRRAVRINQGVTFLSVALVCLYAYISEFYF